MNVLLVLHIIIVIALIITILMQKSSSDGFTSGGGASGGNALFSSRGKANALTRATSFLATAFIINSLVLAYIASHSEQNRSVVEGITTQELEAPSTLEQEALDAISTEPTVPLAD